MNSLRSRVRSTSVSGPCSAAIQCRRRGAAIAYVAVSSTLLIGFTALTIDLGYMYVVRTELKMTADAAALAAASKLSDADMARALAQEYATYNMPNHGTVVAANDVVFGHWDVDALTFAPGADPINAVQATARRAQVHGNAVDMTFATLFGHDEADMAATAIAHSLGIGTRFLVDNEMIDSDIPAIQDLAASLGVPPDDLINDGNGDWFIDLPPGAILELPTGQVGDEALFDIDYPEYTFAEGSNPSHTDFLNYNEDGSWRDDAAVKNMLDPLVGVSTISDASVYESFVDPLFVHVSPVFHGDVSVLGPVGGVPAVNALGLRNGLLAFKIIAVGTDPDGPLGSYLPNLVIEVVDPVSLNLNGVKPFLYLSIKRLVGMPNINHQDNGPKRFSL